MQKDENVHTKHICLVTKAHKAIYADPITMHTGDVIEVSGKEDNWQGWIWLWCTNQQGKSGWVPRGFVTQVDGIWKAGYDYSALELSVGIDERVIVLQKESGWLWCTKQNGESGWVPAENVAAC